MNGDTQNYIAFEGATLQEAYEKASKEFKCSITDLKSEIIQAPSNGFLGFFKKNAIINVYKCLNNKPDTQTKHKKKITIKDVSSKIEELHKDIDVLDTHSANIVAKHHKESEKIFDDFYTSDAVESNDIVSIQNDAIIEEIKTDINKLFESLCYKLEVIEVSYYDKNSVLIEFNGEDSALLIGKEGYRYKALSYILFNWIHDKYDLMVRLEIAQFLTQQEESIHKYLEPVIETIKVDGFYKTKQLDGILVHIALTKLREEFPDKYVAVKTNIKGEKYILVNEYKRS